ncbi:MAG: TlpA family protein disulfide reductase [Gammaproteobacteria bacterium]|nr:TlpA family protein disulfide reductase [Gammaproteobacteria bacterium]
MLRTLLLLCALTLPLAPVLGEPLREFNPGPAALDEFIGKGQWVIVKIWASDCEICNREAHQYVDFHEFHKDTDGVMLGISLDGQDRAAALDFIERHEIPYPNLITDYATGMEWYTGVTGRQWIGTPTFLVYDPAGTLRAQQVGAVPTQLIEQFIASNSNTN